MQTVRAQADGEQGPSFSELFAGFGFTGISNPGLNDAAGVGPTDACCECGSGVPASATNDILKLWRMIVYGHGPNTAPGSNPPTPGTPTAPTPAAPSVDTMDVNTSSSPTTTGGAFAAGTVVSLIFGIAASCVIDFFEL